MTISRYSWNLLNSIFIPIFILEASRRVAIWQNRIKSSWNPLVDDEIVILNELFPSFRLRKFPKYIIVYPKLVIVNRHPAERALVILFSEDVKALLAGGVVIVADKSGHSGGPVEVYGTDFALVLLFEDLGGGLHEVIC